MPNTGSAPQRPEKNGMILIFNLSVSLSLDSSPSRGAFGKEISLFVDCQGLSYKERWHPEGMTERLDKQKLTPA